VSKKKQYTLRIPLAVKGGIRAQGAHGGHVRTWWGIRWIEMLERFRLGARLGRGHKYALSGQVSSLAIRDGRVSARVQGSSREPYESVIQFPCVQGEAKTRIVKTFLSEPILLAQLMVGELPHETETIFAEEGCPLFPTRPNELSSSCSCPDWANPCKHLAAVYFLLGEAIIRNPMFLLELHGVRREDLVEEPPAEEADVRSSPDEMPARALTAAAFYGTELPAFTDFGDAPKAITPAPLIHRLGPVPFWRGQEHFTDTLEHLYARASARGWTVWTGEPLDLRREDEKVIIKGANLRLNQNRLRVDESWT